MKRNLFLLLLMTALAVTYSRPYARGRDAPGTSITLAMPITDCLYCGDAEPAFDALCALGIYFNFTALALPNMPVELPILEHRRQERNDLPITMYESVKIEKADYMIRYSKIN